MDETRCYNCMLLTMEEGSVVPENWVSDKCYTCSAGRYAGVSKTYRHWFAWGGIIKPNKTVATAQKECPEFKHSNFVRVSK